MTTTAPVLVLGGTGMTGRRITTRLQNRGVPVRVGSRAGRPPFDWNDRSTWSAVVAGTSAVYLCYSPDLALPGAAETVADLADATTAAGAQRLVLLSGRGEAGAQHAEALVGRSAETAGADWTVVRASWFAQNFTESFLLDAVRAGTVALPVGDVREPFIDAEDIADVVTVALLDDGHAGEIYEVTGPRLLTFAEATGEIARATGRAISFRPVTAAEFGASLAADGLPADVLQLMDFLFTEVMDGRNASLADGVQRALGRAPRDFADVASRAAAGGVFSPVGAGR
jgi:uncharacterized protein YbjT (DUF2867 family)